MKTTPIDSVMAEIHAIKDANSARFGHDLNKLFEHLRKKVRETRSGTPAGTRKASPGVVSTKRRKSAVRKKVNA